jgi:vacuolar-type H+-ATPase subunit H
VQQLAASITLAAPLSELQETADGVSRVAVGDGGFVQSSHVQVQQTGTSEANLDLSLPSAKLSAALASLGQIAPVRAESQSLQDITNTYDAARQRVSDASAERQALLRALSKATTEGQIDSLHERLSQNRTAIAQAQSALQTVSQHASTAEVEVTVLGDTHTASEGLTLHRGLRDAGGVLVVILIVLLIAAAILLPLALVLAALAAGRRAWRRYQRERMLQPPETVA